MPHWAQSILDFLNTPMVKFAMVFLGTAILRAWPKFVNEAVPIWTALYSVITAVLGALFPGHGLEGTTQPAVFMLTGYALAGAAPWWHSLLASVWWQGVYPWMAGFATQRGVSQTTKFVTGAPVEKTTGYVSRKPFQSTIPAP